MRYPRLASMAIFTGTLAALFGLWWLSPAVAFTSAVLALVALAGFFWWEG